MRTTLPLVALTLLVGCKSMEPVGTESAESFHGANVIYVAVDGTPAEAIETASSALTIDGWPIANSTPTTISTEWRSSDVGLLKAQYDARFTIAAIQEDGQTLLALRGEQRMMDVTTDIERTGQGGSPRRRAWESLASVASSIGEIERYARR